MVGAYQDSIAVFEEKFRLLLSEYQRLKEENAQLRLSLDTCKNELHESKNTILELNSDYQILKVARAFGQSEQDKKEAYRRITRMMRDIDKCLDLLNE